MTHTCLSRLKALFQEKNYVLTTCSRWCAFDLALLVEKAMSHLHPHVGTILYALSGVGW